MTENTAPKTGAEAIEQRDAGYGGFANVAATKREIMRAFAGGAQFMALDDVELTALEEIAGKLARIANGKRKADNWIDIAGYAGLVTIHSPRNAEQLVPPPPPKRTR